MVLTGSRTSRIAAGASLAIRLAQLREIKRPAGDQFRLTDGEWHFNLETRAAEMSAGVWELRAVLSDGTKHSMDSAQVMALAELRRHGAGSGGWATRDSSGAFSLCLSVDS
jgi:hypothetical protein